RHRDDEREAVGKRCIQRFRAAVEGLLHITFIRRGWVHGRPAVKELVEQNSLDPSLVDDGEELVLEIGPAAGNLVDENGVGAPDGRGCLYELEAATPVGERVADQVVVIEQAGVEVPQ